jgi:hypothetical protein
MFEQDAVVKSLGDQLSALESIIKWSVLIAIPVAWAGIRRDEVIKAGFLEIQRKYAFYAVATLFVIVNVACLVLFLRVGELIVLLEDKNLTKGLSGIAFHSWPFNPFSYYGGGFLARLQSCAGFGLLIVIWWIAYSALATFREGVSYKVFVCFGGVFLGFGLATMRAIYRDYSIILDRLSISNPRLYAAVSDTIPERTVAAFVGIGVGGMIFTLTYNLQQALGTQAVGPSQQEIQVEAYRLWELDGRPLGRDGSYWSQAIEKLNTDGLHPVPHPIIMQGLPVHLSGWNGVYYLTRKTKNGRGVWARPEHWYRGWLPLRIIGVTIWFDGKAWNLQRDCDSEGVAMLRSKHSGDTPVGDWEGKAKVIESTTLPSSS